MKLLTNSPHNPIFSATTVRRGLETFPQELYDQIYTEVFTAPSGTYFPTKSGMSPLLDQDLPDFEGEILPFKATPYKFNLLHVSRASRTLYARGLYGSNSQFIFRNAREPPSYDCTYTKIYYKWLEMLPREHRALAPKVLLTDMVMGGDYTALIAAEWARNKLVKQGLEFGEENAHNLFVYEHGQIYGGELDKQAMGKNGRVVFVDRDGNEIKDGGNIWYSDEEEDDDEDEYGDEGGYENENEDEDQVEEETLRAGVNWGAAMREYEWHFYS